MELRRRSFGLAALVAVLALGIQPPTTAEAQTLTADQLTAFNYRSIGPTRQSGRFVDFAAWSELPRSSSLCGSLT